ncbi:MAG TPA: chemotaxis protein CheB, partial [Pyrinomonadaceae bacterium]
MSDSLKSDLFFGDGREHGGAARGFLVVGIGASAGGIQSLKEFFSRVPPDSGMAYVVILHLSPDYESRLAEVLQSATPLPVTQVKERVRVEPDHVYVISPNRSLAMVDGHLTLSAIKRVEERRAPVDIFFRTLAESKHERAVCVILSGTGADGSMGMKRIKETGGVCIVQDPAEAEYSDMPRNSVATGLVDYVLPVAEIPAKIVAYGKHLSSISGPAGPGERPESDGLALRDIFTQLRASAGHDFTNYKRSTVLRRVERRMSVNEVSDLPAYARFLREQADEPRALLKDLLISVTNFFRDPEPFRALEEKFVPRLFESKGAKDHVRAWAAGCATGEEAYSIAMLLSEFASDLASPPHVQVFATDIDEWAVAKAREGFYTLNDVADVSPGRLRRFFVKEDAGFRVRRELREMVLFAPHNLIKDPPFSHLDLVTCRNLLIYLNRTAQGRVMEVLHFSLNPGGYLFLGTAESVEGSGDLFVAADKESHIFQSRPAETRVTLPFMHALTATAPRPIPFRAEQERGREKRAEQITYLDLHQRLLEQYAPPSVVVNEEYEIVRLSESAGRYMQVAGGEPSNNLLRLVRPELRLELRAALYQAVQKRMNVEARDLEVDVDGKAARVNLQVRPVLRDDDATRGFILVIFEDGLGAWRGPDEALVARGEPMARQLEEELVRSKAQLSLSVEQYELQQEELKASNEELQAMNEELHSSAEELETSKEELQSLNEELTTVNQELKIKIEELSQANNDFRNLMNSTDIGTLFLDRSLRVKLFTPRARDIFNLIPSDAGRPLLDLT